MSIATMTSKGQTTIPVAIRNHLGLHTGDKIEFFIEEDGRVLLTPMTVHASELKGILPQPKKIITVEKMNKIISERGAKK